jgi:hypothetical protein
MTATVGQKANLLNYVGKEGEFSFTRDTQEVRIMNGSTAGGILLADVIMADHEPEDIPDHIGAFYVDLTSGSVYVAAGDEVVDDWRVITLDIPDAYIGTDMIQNRAVTQDKLAVGAVASDNVSAEAITTSKIAQGAITEALLAAGAVTSNKIANGAVLEAAIDNEAITEAKLASNSISAAKLIAGSVTTDALAANAVTAVKLVAGAVEADKIATNAVTTAAIAAGAVVAGKIAAGSITAGDGVIASLSFEKMVGGTLGTGALFVGDAQVEIDGANSRISVYDELGSARVDLGLIEYDEATDESTYGIAIYDANGDEVLFAGGETTYLSGAHINEISATKITSGTLDAAVVTVTNLDADNITAGLLNGDLIKGQSIEAHKLNVNFLSAISANLGVITAGTLNADVAFLGTIEADQINAGSLNSDVLYTGTLSASQITTGTLSADRLTGQTITSVTIKASYITGVTIDGTTITGGTINSTTLKAVNIEGITGTNQTIYMDGQLSSRTDDHLTIRAVSRFSAHSYTILATAYYNNGIAVYGQCNNTGGRGVYGRANGSDGIGVLGRADHGSGWAFYATGAGGNYGPFTGAHDALILKGTEAMPGDIVVDVGVIHKRDISNCLCEVALSTQTNSPAIGVLVSVSVMGAYDPPNAITRRRVVRKPEGTDGEEAVLMTSFQHLPQAYDKIIMNGLGEGQINVCGQNGDIQIGDLITTSNIPGKGMKQQDSIVRSHTVAKAREAVTFSSPTEVKQIACIYMCG